jgi:thymidylate synthase
MTVQYLELGNRLMNEGTWIHNTRTNTNCLTLINHDMTYNVGAGEFPLVTTRKSYYKAAIAELLGYIRGYDNAQQFADIGSPTWFANSDNPVWISNPAYNGKGDLGRVYGVQGRDWTNLYGETLDQLSTIVDKLNKRDDDRGLILSFWNPGEFSYGCLRPCMFQHHFSLAGDTLYLNSYQRSMDVPLGGNFNMVQVYVLLALIAQITNLKPGIAYHKMVNIHVYENQFELFQQQLLRVPYPHPTLSINPAIKSLYDLETWVTTDDFTLSGYQYHEPIIYPFTT